MPAPINYCPECGMGVLIQRASGFWSCEDCGKLVINPAGAAPPKQEPSLVDLDALGKRAKRLNKVKQPENWDATHLPPPPINTEGGITVPDFTEVMIGWRAWRIDRDWRPGMVPLLTSVTYKSAKWHPGQAVEATCSKGGNGHVPGEQCSCGLYAAKTREHLIGMGYHLYNADNMGEFRVMGAVSLWGKVIEGTQGWRAQLGYPRKLFVPYEAYQLAEPLRTLYRCEVTLDNILKDPSK